jgi:NitT/TauT family transport system substrate-binding protein
MIRRSFWLRATAGAAGVAAALPHVARAQDLPVVRIGLAEGDDATPALYALKVGLFKKYGLDVQVQRAPSGAASLAAVAGNAIEIGGSSMLSFLLAHTKGVPISIVAPLAVYAPESLYAALIVKKDSPLKTGKDLNGKTIGSPALHDLNWIATAAWVDQNGGDSSTMKTVELPSSAIATAIDEGRIDCSTVTTPRYVQAVNTGKVRILGRSYEAIAKNFMFAAYVANNDWAAKNVEIVQRFGRAIRDASRYSNTHHADTLPIYAEFAKIDIKDIADAPRAISPPYVEVKALQPLIDVAAKYKLIDRIDPQTLISPSCLKPGAA